MKTIDTRLLIREPMPLYQEKAKAHLTSHRLAEFRRCPLLFHRKELGLVKDEDRPAFQLGRAAHSLILEGREVFEKEFAVGGPINAKTGRPYGSRTKAFDEWAAAQGRPVINDESLALITNLHESVKTHKHAAELLVSGVAECVLRAEYLGVPCQSRLDWVNPERGIVDLKTCDNIDWLQMDARSYGYAHQLAFYRAMIATVTGVLAQVWLICVEKREPFRTGVWSMGNDVLGIAQKENEEAIDRLKKLRKADTWPTGYEDVRLFDYL